MLEFMEKQCTVQLQCSFSLNFFLNILPTHLREMLTFLTILTRLCDYYGFALFIIASSTC